MCNDITISRDDGFWKRVGLRFYGQGFLDVKEEFKIPTFLGTFEFITKQKIRFFDDSLLRSTMVSWSDRMIKIICSKGDINVKHICEDPQFWEEREERKRKRLPFYEVQ